MIRSYKKMTVNQICGFFLCLVSLSGFSGNQVALIENNRANVTIVVEDMDNPVTRMAGEELRAHLRKRTGVQVPLVNASEKWKAGTIPLYLGLSERTRKLGADPAAIKADGFFLKVTPEYIVIAGRDNPLTKDKYHGHDFVIGNEKYKIYMLGETGTLNGVYKFLERYAGIRWYMPGELGCVVPRDPDFKVPEMTLLDAPAFSYRLFWGMYFRDAELENLLWYRRLCSGSPDNIQISHNYQEIFHRYKDTKPEFFALIDGKRDLSNLSTANPFGNLCFSNEEVVKAFAGIACQFFDQNPDCIIYPVVPQDGMFRICECPGCKQLYSPHLGENGKFSNAVFTLAAKVAAEVAKRHPGKLIGTLAYERHRMPPDIELPANLAVRICYNRQDMRDPQKKKEIESVIAGFAAKKVPIYVWTYPLYNHIPPFRGLPIFYPELLQENILFNLRHGVRGEFSEASYYSGGGDQYIHKLDFALPGLTHLNNYVRAQLLWKPDLNLKALLEEYYAMFYGPSAAEMRMFWETARDLYMAKCEPHPLNQYTKDDILKLYGLLDQASRKAGGKTPYSDRIALIHSEMDLFLKPLLTELSYTRIFSVPTVKEKIPVKFDSRNSAWRYARKYTFTRKDGRAADVKNKTELYVLANKDGIALHGIAMESDMKNLHTATAQRDHEDTWKDDCFEIYLISEDRSVNLLYMITASGNVYDTRLNKNVNIPDERTWTSGMQLEVSREKDRFQFTAVIPWSDLKTGSDSVPPLKFQCYRRRTGGSPENGEYFSVFPVLDARNYAPEHFPAVHFMAPENLLLNGSFEQLDENGSPIAWNQPFTGVLIASEKASGGKHAVLLNKERKNGLNYDFVACKPFPVIPDTDYSLRFRHQGWEGVAYVFFFDKNNKPIPEPNRPHFSVAPSEDWETVLCTGRVPAGAVTVQIAFRIFELPSDKAGMAVDEVEFFGNGSRTMP